MVTDATKSNVMTFIRFSRIKVSITIFLYYLTTYKRKNRMYKTRYRLVTVYKTALNRVRVVEIINTRYLQSRCRTTRIEHR